MTAEAGPCRCTEHDIEHDIMANDSSAESGAMSGSEELDESG